MKITVKKWGNSLGIRIPKKIVSLLALHDGVHLEIKEGDKKITLQKKSTPLDELIQNINPENRHKEIDSGPILGSELW